MIRDYTVPTGGAPIQMATDSQVDTLSVRNVGTVPVYLNDFPVGGGLPLNPGAKVSWVPGRALFASLDSDADTAGRLTLFDFDVEYVEPGVAQMDRSANLFYDDWMQSPGNVESIDGNHPIEIDLTRTGWNSLTVDLYAFESTEPFDDYFEVHVNFVYERAYPEHYDLAFGDPMGSIAGGSYHYYNATMWNGQTMSFTVPVRTSRAIVTVFPVNTTLTSPQWILSIRGSMREIDQAEYVAINNNTPETVSGLTSNLGDVRFYSWGCGGTVAAGENLSLFVPSRSGKGIMTVRTGAIGAGGLTSVLTDMRNTHTLAGEIAAPTGNYVHSFDFIGPTRAKRLNVINNTAAVVTVFYDFMYEH